MKYSKLIRVIMDALMSVDGCCLDNDKERELVCAAVTLAVADWIQS